MMIGTRRNETSRRARAEINEAVDSGAGLDELERELVEQPALSREERDALWLFAWSQLERRQVRTRAREWRRPAARPR